MTLEEIKTRLATTGRNDDCPCKSGKKYKKCHQAEDLAARQKADAAEFEKKEAAAKAEAEKTVGDEKNQTHGEGPHGPRHSHGGKAAIKANSGAHSQVRLPRKSGSA